MSSLRVSYSVPETQVLDWLSSILSGSLPTLKVQLVFTNPTFTTVDVSDVIAQLCIEDQLVLETSIGFLYIPAGQSIVKESSFPIEKALTLSSLIAQATAQYGGEVKVTIRGSGTAHLLMMSTRLPFEFTQYYITTEGCPLKVTETSTCWTDSQGRSISTTSIGSQVSAKVTVYNPRRSQSISGTILVAIMRDIPFWFDEQMTTSSRVISVSPQQYSSASFPFTPLKKSTYHFSVSIEGTQVYVQPNTSPPRLTVP